MNYPHCEAYSFGKSNLNNPGPIPKSYGPGSGKYYPKTSLIQPSPFVYKLIRINIEKRLDKSQESTPGVGDYIIQSSIPRGPSYTMRPVVDGIISSKNCSPGPCNYDIKTTVNGPVYSLGERHVLSADNVHNPGPGEYNLSKENNIKGLMNSNFSKELRSELNNLNGSINSIQLKSQGPSPCDYNPNTQIILKQQPTCSINKAKREELFIPKYPGPAQYDIKPTIGNEGPKYSFNNIIHEHKENKEYSPGPGQYNLTFVDKPNNPCFKMNLSDKNNFQKQDHTNKRYTTTLPGPCDYSINSSTVIKKSFSNAPLWGRIGVTRNKMKDSSGPGTGKYNISDNMGKGPKFSLGSRISPNKKWQNSIPGPGSYEINKSAANLRKNPAWIIGHEPRLDTFSQNNNKLPGPAEYNNDSKDNYSIRPNLFFGKEKKLIDTQTNKEVQVSGPGHYKIPCSIVNVNPYTRKTGKFNNQFKYV